MSVFCCYLHFTILEKNYPVKNAVFYRYNKTFSFSCGYSSEFRRIFGFHAQLYFHRRQHISAERQRHLKRYIRGRGELRNISRCRCELRIIHIDGKPINSEFRTVRIAFNVLTAAALQSEQLIQPSVNIARRNRRFPRVTREPIPA